MSQTHYMAAQQPFELQVRASQPRSAPDPDDPDVVALWQRTVNVGLLGGGYVPAVQSKAASLSSRSGEDAGKKVAETVRYDPLKA